MAARGDRRTQLRVAVYQGDDPVGVALLSARRHLDDQLHLVGDGLLAALARDVADAAEHASWCDGALGVLDWDRDVVLGGPTRRRTRCGGDSHAAAAALDLDGWPASSKAMPLSVAGRIDLESGDVKSGTAIGHAKQVGEEAEDESDDSDRWQWL